MDISTMDEAQCKTFFNETFGALENFRLMYPTEWRQNLTGDILNKYIVCVEVHPKIQSLQGLALLRKLVTHLNDVLIWAQNIEQQVLNPPPPPPEEQPMEQ